MQFLPSTHSRLAVMATLGALLARPPLAQATTPTFIQGVAFSTPQIPSTTVTLTRPVAQGDLLVGWFSQYNAPGEVRVSDNVNGTWTRAAAGAQSVDDDRGDIALYYRENSRAAPGGLPHTVSVSPPALLQVAAAACPGVAHHPSPAPPPVPRSTPTGLGSTSVASTRVALSWSPASGSVAGYAVYRDGAAIGTTGPDSTIFLDGDVTPASTHTYSVDAFDL